MEFNQVKALILEMRDNPYILTQKISMYCPEWMFLAEKMLRIMEKVLNEEEINENFEERELKVLLHGASLLPAFLLEVDSEDAWKYYEAISMLYQNYGAIFNNAEFSKLALILQKLPNAKNTLSGIITQAESLLLQMQASISNSAVPYKLSRQFLTSLLEGE